MLPKRPTKFCHWKRKIIVAERVLPLDSGRSLDVILLIVTVMPSMVKWSQCSLSVALCWCSGPLCSVCSGRKLVLGCPENRSGLWIILSWLWKVGMLRFSFTDFQWAWRGRPKFQGKSESLLQSRSVGIQSALRVFKFGRKWSWKICVGSGQLTVAIGSLHNVFVFH